MPVESKFTNTNAVEVSPHQLFNFSYHNRYSMSEIDSIYDFKSGNSWLLEVGEGKRRTVVLEWNSTIIPSDFDQSVSELSQIILNKPVDLKKPLPSRLQVEYEFHGEYDSDTQLEVPISLTHKSLTINSPDRQHEYAQARASESPTREFIDRRIYSYRVDDMNPLARGNFAVIFNRRDPYPVRPIVEFPKTKKNSEELWDWIIDHHVADAAIKRKGIRGKDIVEALAFTAPSK